MLSGTYLNRVKESLKNEVDCHNQSEVENHLFYVMENIRGNLGAIEKNFTLNIGINKHIFFHNRLSVLMAIDNCIENLIESIEKRTTM